MHFTTLVVLSDPSLTNPDDAFAALTNSLAPFDAEYPNDVADVFDDVSEETTYFREHPTECGPDQDGPEHTWEEVREDPDARHLWTLQAVSAFHGFGPDHGVHVDGMYGYLSPHNPNTRWDYWRLGGRWAGFFDVTPGTRVVEAPDLIDQLLAHLPGRQPPPGPVPADADDAGEAACVGEVRALIGSGARPEYDRPVSTRADLLRRADLDLAGMRHRAVEEAHRIYDKVEEATAGLPRPRSWRQIADELALPAPLVRSVYAAQPWVQAVCAYGLGSEHGDPVRELLVNEGGREAYVLALRRDTTATSALVVDGTWVDLNDEDQPPHDQVIDTLPDHAWLAVVDCHM